jgi:anaerobic selenocysteine-containing dehydrogenase
MLTTNLTEEGACGVDEAAVTDAWHPTACILCECNCGIEIKLGADGRTFERIHGDKLHPSSAGYTCNKALRLDRYQNGAPDRLTSPLRRRADGTFEEISWDIAVAEVAGRMRDVADQLGVESIFYYGGG